MASRIRSAYDTGHMHGEYAAHRLEPDRILFEKLADNPYKSRLKQSEYEKGLYEGFNSENCVMNKAMNEVI